MALHERYFMALETNQHLQLYGDLKFWFSWTEQPNGLTFSTVAAMHLWEYRLVSIYFPELTDTHGKEVRLTPGRPIAVMTTRPDARQLIESKLSSQNLTPRVLEDREIREGSQAFELIVFTPQPQGQELDVSLDDVRATAGTVTADGEGTLRIATPGQPFAYGAALTLPVSLTSGYGGVPAFLSFHVKVEDGPFSIALLTQDGKSVIDEQQAARQDGFADIVLTVPNLAAAGDVVFRSWTKPPDRAVLQSAKAYVPNGVTPILLRETALPLSGFVKAAGTVEAKADGLDIVTPALSWGYGAVMPLDDVLPVQASGPAVIQVRLLPGKGSVGIGVTSRDEREFVAGQQVAPGPRPVNVYLAVPDIAAAGSLVVRTWDKPESSQVHILSAKLVWPPAAAP